jgi:histidinol-phosphate aminotransferase
MESRLKVLEKYIKAGIQELEPYAAEAGGPPVRLDANESPFDIPQDLKQEILEGFRALPWNRYPDPECWKLRQALAKRSGVTAEQLIVGNGSDEIIRDLLTAYGGTGTQTVFPIPTFGMFRILTLVTGGKPVEVRLKDDWSLDIPSLLRELKAEATRMLFLASPNNPTGNVIPVEQVEEILKSTDCLVVVDEAYGLFAGQSILNRLGKYPNLAVLSTFSKAMSLAGVRVGYLAAHPEIIRVLNRVRLPYNLDALAQHAALKVMANFEFWKEQAGKIAAERERVSGRLSQHPEVTVYPSQANFVLIRVKQAQSLKQELARNGVAVRGFPARERLHDCLRITIGRPEENDQLLKLLETALGR